MRFLHSPVVIALFTATVAAQTWAVVPVTTGPTTRRAGAMAFDAVSGRLIAYGGLSVSPSGILAETWSFGAPPTAGGWTLLSPTGNVPPRWGHRMVRNTVNNRLVTFGGRSPTTGAYANDTWEYTGAASGGGSWAPVATATAPAARHFYGLAFDEARNVAVLFGGSSNQATFDDIWEYDGATWTQRTFALSPPAREDMVFVYDPALNRTVLFGGLDTDTNEVFGDTWLYDGTQWYQLPPTATSPTARFSSSAVFDSFRKRVMLFGGFDGAAQFDTWQFGGDRWVAVPTTGPTPPNSTEAYAGYDPTTTRRKTVLFGGFGTVFTNQTWELTVPTSGGNQLGLFGTYGPGCTILENEPSIAAPAPVINTTLNVTFGNLPDTSVTLGVIGFSNRTWGAIPLPFDLGVLGFGSCDLLVSADVVATTPAPVAGVSTLPVPIPNVQTLINAVIYLQGVVFDLASGLNTTPPARAIIGN